MPWYRVFCNSGPGHQSHHEFYHWEDEKLTKEGKSNLFEESFHDRDWPIGDVLQVQVLPTDVKKAKIQQYEHKRVDVVKQCNKLLKILKQTPGRGCAHIHTRSIRDLPPMSFSVQKCLNCNKIKIYGYGVWRTEPKDLAKAASMEEYDRKRKRKN